jgi:hypothetical protein
MAKNKVDKISPVVRLTQEAVERLEAETIRKSVRAKRVLTKGEVLSALIMSNFPLSSAPLMEHNGEHEVEKSENTDTKGN